MSNSGHRRGGPKYPNAAPDDLLNDELPDYSSRRSSYNDQKINPYDADRGRKVSTASNTLEVPNFAKYDRQNSMASLVSNSSVNTFSYRNLGKAKIKNAFGSLIVFIGLGLLVLGILFLIFGHQLSLKSVITVDITPSGNTTGNYTTGSDGESNAKYRVSALETIGYFVLFSGILLILIGISIICHEMRPTAKPQPTPSPNYSPNITLKRKVSTIELEPQEVTNKPEIMITTDNFKESVSYKKYQNPEPNLQPRPSFSQDDNFSPKVFNDYQKRFPF